MNKKDVTKKHLLLKSSISTSKYVRNGAEIALKILPLFRYLILMLPFKKIQLHKPIPQSPHLLLTSFKSKISGIPKFTIKFCPSC